MRQIGTLDNEAHASRFVDFLKTQKIAAQLEADDKEWLIWVKDENHVETARGDLADFKANPNAEQYRDVARVANEIRAAEIKKRSDIKKNHQQVRTQWSGPLQKRAPVTFYLIAICVGVALLGGSFYGETLAKRFLKFADFGDAAFLESGTAFYHILRGQLWRLITPIFLHAEWFRADGQLSLSGALHIIFNLYWLRFLGSQIESKIGSQRFLLIVLATALFPNVMQAVLTGPNFVGISGVVYGLFGYVLVRRRDGYRLDQFIVILLFVFLVMDFTGAGMFRNVAVWAHAGGLATGAFVGYLPELMGKR